MMLRDFSDFKFESLMVWVKVPDEIFYLSREIYWICMICMFYQHFLVVLSQDPETVLEVSGDIARDIRV